MTLQRRALQPGTLVPDGQRLWVLDQLQPVAVLLDAGTGAVLQRSAWGSVLQPPESPDWPGGWWGEVVEDGLLVQAPHRDGVALLRPGRPPTATDVPSLIHPHPRPRPMWVDGTPSAVDWLRGPDTVAAGRRWRVGWSRADHAFPRPLYAVGEWPDGDRVRALIGHGTAVTALTHRDAVWVAVEHPRLLGTYTHPVPIALVRLDTASGRLDTVLPADAVDVGDLCWPLVPEPAHPQAFAQQWRGTLQSEAPQWSVTVVSRWPDSELVVVLPHPDAPGVRLRRRFPVFDELGRQDPPQYAVTHIEEELATAGPPDVPPGVTLLDF